MSDSGNALIGRELRELRNFRGMSATDVDRALGWRANKTTEIERDPNPRLEHVRAYLALFDLTLGEFERYLEARVEYERRHADFVSGGSGINTGWSETAPDLRELFRAPLAEQEEPVVVLEERVGVMS